MDKSHFPPNHNHPNKSLAGLLIRLSHIFGNKIKDEIKKTGITKPFGHILMFLYDNEGVSQKHLAKDMHFKASSISVSLQSMEESGYVRREVSANDQRQIKLFLTEKGIEISKKIKDVFEGVETELFSAINEEEKEILSKILKKLFAEMNNEEN